MNIGVIVVKAKLIAASEGGKAVITAGKSIGDKLLKGVTYGAGIGAFVAGTKFGYKASSKGLPAVMKPVIDILENFTAGTPQFTVTFTDVREKEKTVEEPTEEQPAEQE